MSSLAHVRRLFPMPRWEEIRDKDRYLLGTIDHTGDKLAAMAIQHPVAGLGLGLRAPAGWFPGLAHELSFRFPGKGDGFAHCRRAAAEWAILCDHHRTLVDTLDGDDSAAFIDTIISIARSAAGVDGLRREPIGTTPDENGHYVIFPSEHVVEHRLQYLFATLQRQTAASRAFEAILALVWMTHCHPFIDGNGRTARILFNMLLQRNAQIPRFYLPLYEMSSLSRRGYILCVREAELYGRWGPLFEYVRVAIALWFETLAAGENPSCLAEV